MEPQFQLEFDGQAIYQDDFNNVIGKYGLIDDRVFAELLRMAPYNGSTVSRGVLPYGSPGTVVPNGASGSVSVNPFRAVVGSRTAVATSGLDNWRDIRSAVSVGATTLAQTVAIGANSSGNPRWDLVYAAVSIDANGPSVTRKVKNPTTQAITGNSVTQYLQTSVSLAVVAGTPGASPAFPSVPADSGSTYYIALAFVRVPNGFNASSTVAGADINTIANILPLNSPGCPGIRPADQHYVLGGTAISGTGTTGIGGGKPFTWTGAASERPMLYFPPDMAGGERIFAVCDLTSASSANWSHQNGGVVDASRDWRSRLFKWFARFSNGFIPEWAATPPLVIGDKAFVNEEDDSDQAFVSGSTGITRWQTWGLATSFQDNASPVGQSTLFFLTSSNVHGINSSGAVGLGVDMTTGALKINVVNAPEVCVFFWIEATNQFANY